jgi:Carboxylesterase family
MNFVLLLGLFRGVIAQSGSALADWALDRDGRKHGLRIAELAGCPLANQTELVHCLRTIDAKILLRAVDHANVWRIFFKTLNLLDNNEFGVNDRKKIDETAV